MLDRLRVDLLLVDGVYISRVLLIQAMINVHGFGELVVGVKSRGIQCVSSLAILLTKHCVYP